MEYYTATKKEQSTGSWMNYWSLHHEWNPHTLRWERKTDTKTPSIIWLHIIYMMFWKRQNYKNRKEIAEDQVWKDWLQGGLSEFGEWWSYFRSWLWWWLKDWSFFQCSENCALKGVNFTVCRLYQENGTLFPSTQEHISEMQVKAISLEG